MDELQEIIQSMSIEKVSNGFIIKENPPLYDDRHHERNGVYRVPITKVFNTTKQLNKYINEKLNK